MVDGILKSKYNFITETLLFWTLLVVNTSAKGHIEHSYNGIEKLKHLV